MLNNLNIERSIPSVIKLFYLERPDTLRPYIILLEHGVSGLLSKIKTSPDNHRGMFLEIFLIFLQLLDDIGDYKIGNCVRCQCYNQTDNRLLDYTFSCFYRRLIALSRHPKEAGINHQH